MSSSTEKKAGALAGLMTLLAMAGVIATFIGVCSGLATGHKWNWYVIPSAQDPVSFPIVKTLGNEDSLEVAHYDLLAKEPAGKGILIGLCDQMGIKLILKYANNKPWGAESLAPGRRKIGTTEWQPAHVYHLYVGDLTKGGDVPVKLTNEGTPGTIVLGVQEYGVDPELLLAECPAGTMGFVRGRALRDDEAAAKAARAAEPVATPAPAVEE